MPYNTCPVCNDKGYRPYCSECGAVEETPIQRENGRRYCANLPPLTPGHIHGVTVTVLGCSLDGEVNVQFTNYWNDNGKTLPDASTIMELEEFEKYCKDHGYTWADFSNGQSIECMEDNKE